MNIKFLDYREAIRILTNRDEFIKSMSPFDRAARVKTEGIISEAEFLNYISKQVLNWGSFECSNIDSILEDILVKFENYELRFPKQVSLIKTTGKEEGNAAYCRKNAIVLPQTFINTPYQLKNLITHELFHIYSKNNPEKRKELYESIGFFTCPELRFPEELSEFKITNPDAPLNNHFFKDNKDGLIPILFSKEPYNFKKGGEFFAYLQFRLIRVEIKEESCEPIYYNEKLQLYKAEDIPSYVRKIGMNTDYIIHPEEILAENFVLLINNSRYIRSPEILEKIENIMCT
ncbi:MAG: hypothetical protein EU532_04185 [Promethearchaeota archaeon]|nr:MAG: hypothetical protein EU532_04185 [Candidatus Lokiarchaeota archaeon]